ncbi:hypothetical protein [Actinoplanes xinjiangensis]|uniref:hypothetical protein n=1 Tax=Actinoplanes xinjiangensis TaxID=512350 RepID=UPI0034195A05
MTIVIGAADVRWTGLQPPVVEIVPVDDGRPHRRAGTVRVERQDRVLGNDKIVSSLSPVATGDSSRCGGGATGI